MQKKRCGLHLIIHYLTESNILSVSIHCSTLSPDIKMIFGKCVRLERQSLIVCWIEAPEVNGLFFKFLFLFFLMLFSLQWLMRKHPKVNTSIWLKDPSCCSSKQPHLPPPVSYFPVHCGMTNKQVQAEEESNVQPPHQGSAFLKASWSTRAESPGL